MNYSKSTSISLHATTQICNETRRKFGPAPSTWNKTLAFITTLVYLTKRMYNIIAMLPACIVYLQPWSLGFYERSPDSLNLFPAIPLLM